MNCPKCHGKGVLFVGGLYFQAEGVPPRLKVRSIRPCDQCGGSGSVHCCDGEQCQADGESPEEE